MRVTRRGARAADKGPSASLAPSARALNVQGVRLAPGLRAPPRIWTLLAAPARARLVERAAYCGGFAGGGFWMGASGWAPLLPLRLGVAGPLPGGFTSLGDPRYCIFCFSVTWKTVIMPSA